MAKMSKKKKLPRLPIKQIKIFLPVINKQSVSIGCVTVLNKVGLKIFAIIKGRPLNSMPSRQAIFINLFGIDGVCESRNHFKAFDNFFCRI